MRFFLLLMLLVSSLFSKNYYSRVEPYEIRTIMSNVSGEVLHVEYSMLGKKLGNKAFITIDSSLDKDELQQTKKKITYVKEMIKIVHTNIENIEKMLQKKELNYKSVVALNVKSKVEKDREFYDLINTKILLQNTKKELQNYQVQLADLTLHVKQITKRIKDKAIKAPGMLLYSLNVKTAQVVAPAMLVAKVADTSKGILRIYVSEEELKNIAKKKIYIDGKKTQYTIIRFIPVADEKNISQYTIEIEVDAPELFSKLVKIEFKER